MNWLRMMKEILLAVSIAAQEIYGKMAGVITETVRSNNGTVTIVIENLRIPEC